MRETATRRWGIPSQFSLKKAEIWGHSWAAGKVPDEHFTHLCPSSPGSELPGLNHPLPFSDPSLTPSLSSLSGALPSSIPAPSLNPKLLSYSCHFRPLFYLPKYHHPLKSYSIGSSSKDPLLSSELEGIIFSSSRLREQFILTVLGVLVTVYLVGKGTTPRSWSNLGSGLVTFCLYLCNTSNFLSKSGRQILNPE